MVVGLDTVAPPGGVSGASFHRCTVASRVPRDRGRLSRRSSHGLIFKEILTPLGLIALAMSEFAILLTEFVIVRVRSRVDADFNR